MALTRQSKLQRERSSQSDRCFVPIVAILLCAVTACAQAGAAIRADANAATEQGVEPERIERADPPPVNLSGMAFLQTHGADSATLWARYYRLGVQATQARNYFVAERNLLESVKEAKKLIGDDSTLIK